MRLQNDVSVILLLRILRFLQYIDLTGDPKHALAHLDMRSGCRTWNYQKNREWFPLLMFVVLWLSFIAGRLNNVTFFFLLPIYHLNAYG